MRSFTHPTSPPGSCGSTRVQPGADAGIRLATPRCALCRLTKSSPASAGTCSSQLPESDRSAPTLATAAPTDPLAFRIGRIRSKARAGGDYRTRPRGVTLLWRVELQFLRVESDVDRRRIVDPSHRSHAILHRHLSLGAADQVGVRVDPERGGDLEL